MATTPRGVAVATVLAQAQLKYAEPSGRQSCCETVPSAPDSSHACLSLKPEPRMCLLKQDPARALATAQPKRKPVRPQHPPRRRSP